MAEVRSAALTHDFGSSHKVTAVLRSLDVFIFRGLIEARPASSGIEFCA